MHTLALGLGNLAGPDLLIILSIVLILFGAKKLPDLARSMNEFRKAREDIDRDLKDAVAHPSQPRSSHGATVPSALQGIPGPRDPVGSGKTIWTAFVSHGSHTGKANEVYGVHRRNNKDEQVYKPRATWPETGH
jgi:sec-independent protein translocase protein TatA